MAHTAVLNGGAVSIEELAGVFKRTTVRNRLLDIFKSKKRFDKLNEYLNDSWPINQALRGLHSPKEGIADAVQALLAMFDSIEHLELKQPLILYRGIQTTVGEALADRGFMSTSTDIEIARGFATDHILNIVLLPGYKYKVLPVGSVSPYKREQEVVLAPGRGHFYECDTSQHVGDYRTMSVTTVVYAPVYNGVVAPSPFSDDTYTNAQVLEELMQLSDIAHILNVPGWQIMDDKQLKEAIDKCTSRLRKHKVYVLSCKGVAERTIRFYTTKK
jgi:hypothetical protein